MNNENKKTIAIAIGIQVIIILSFLVAALFKNN